MKQMAQLLRNWVGHEVAEGHSAPPPTQKWSKEEMKEHKGAKGKKWADQEAKELKK